MIHTEEDDEFERIAHEAEMKKGQPYHFDELFVSVSQRNQVLEECAKLADEEAALTHDGRSDQWRECALNIAAAIRNRTL